MYLKKSKIFLLFIWVSIFPPLVLSSTALKDKAMLVIDQKTNIHFRSTLSSLKKEEKHHPVVLGLKELNISGSAQFSGESLQDILKHIPLKEIWIVDLRRESHGFVNYIPISWYAPYNLSNEGLSTSAIEQLESEKLNQISKQPTILLYEILKKEQGKIKEAKPIEIKVHNVQTERALSEEVKAHYLRLPVSDHQRPEDEMVDQFIFFVKGLSANTWLHFHCRGGKGRTTTFMIMYDILRNGKQVPLEDIVLRQTLLGGSQVFNISDSADALWKKAAAKRRKDFIIQFYQYVNAEDGYPTHSWSEWLSLHK